MTDLESSADEQATALEAANGAVLTKVDLEVRGMTCGSCAARVQKVLGRQDGVVD
ncbi:MAG: heavy-metal-associated domain-containing protein, partial [Actinobacteria bacterium]|nr:heavy-metal-associated domain-containing protein [Actinomycetota bacterium]